MLRLWPLTLTLKNNRVILLMMVINYTKLHDSRAYGSVSILPTRFSYLVMLRLWPLTLENNRVLPLMMVIKYTKLYDSRAYSSVSILPTRHWQTSCRTVALWFYILESDHNATDPVMQKSCNLWRNFFFAHFNDLFLHFQVYFQSNIFYFLFIEIF